MRKQARRLWLGDWQRGDEPTVRQPVAADPDGSDTVVITPEDDGNAQPPFLQRRNVQRAIAGVAAVAVLCVLGFGLSSRTEDTPVASERSQGGSPQAPPAQAPQAQPQVPQTQVPPGFGGPDLTGPEATKAAKAAVAKYPGDIERVTRGPAGGGYVVHVIEADGNEVHVIVDDQFKVRGSDANSGPRNSRPGTPQ
jgi:hypothetical protein